MDGWKRHENRVVRRAFREQIVAGESRAQTDKAKVNFAPFKSFELLCAGHVEKVQRHVRAEFAESSKRGRKLWVKPDSAATCEEDRGPRA